MSYNYPDENIDPRKKTKKEFILAYCKAALYNYNNLPEGAIGWASRVKYDQYSLYSRGSQPIDKYKKAMNNGEDGDKNLLVLDWRVLPLMAKLMVILNGRLANLTFKPQIDPIDDLAKEEMDKELMEQEAKIIMRDQLQMQGADPDLLNLPDVKKGYEEAEDLDELSILELGMRHATAMEMEMVVDGVFNYCGFYEMLERWNMDMVKYGVCVGKSELINKTVIDISYEDPRNLVMSFCRKPDFSDWRYMGLMRSYPVSQLIAQSNGQLSEEDIKAIYEIGANQMQQWKIGELNWGVNYDDYYAKGLVYVLDIEIRSTDKKVLETRVTKTGNKSNHYTNPVAEKKEKNTYEETTIENIYCAKWVVGTDIVYDIYKKRNMKRPASNLSKVEPSIRVYGCNVWEMMAKSRVDELIGYADGMQMAAYKIQHILNTTVGNSYAINYDALEAVDLGAGGGKLTPKDLINLWIQRRIIIHRSQGLGSDGKSMPLPINAIPGAAGQELVEYWNQFNTYYNLMRDNLGLNELTDASTPNPKTLTTIANLANQSTDNALSDITQNQRRLVKDYVRDVVRLCQYVVIDGNDELLVSSLGSGSIKRLRTIKDIDKYLYSVQIKENPTPEEIITLNEQIRVSLETGDLKVSDAFMLSNMDNTKQMQAYIVSRVKKNRLEAQRLALEQQQQNGQIQIQSAQAAEQAKLDTQAQIIQMQLDADLKKIDAEKDKDLSIEEMRLEGKRIDAQGRVSSSEVQTIGRDVNNQRETAVKLMTVKEKSFSEGEIKKVVNNAGELEEQNYQSPVIPQTANNEPLKLQEFSFINA